MQFFSRFIEANPGIAEVNGIENLMCFAARARPEFQRWRIREARTVYGRDTGFLLAIARHLHWGAVWAQVQLESLIDQTVSDNILTPQIIAIDIEQGMISVKKC